MKIFIALSLFCFNSFAEKTSQEHFHLTPGPDDTELLRISGDDYAKNIYEEVLKDLPEYDAVKLSDPQYPVNGKIKLGRHINCVKQILGSKTKYFCALAVNSKGEAFNYLEQHARNSLRKHIKRP